MFLLRLFGGASLEDESGPVSGRATQRRRVALLATLAIEHPRPVNRDRLVAWLWPEHDTDRARHLLRDSLYLLRGVLGEDVMRTVGDELRLNPHHLRCDLWEFEEALRQDRLEDAVRVYTGPLFDGVHLAGASELERWIDTARDRLARAQGRALERLADTAAASAPAVAVEWWQRRLEGDPLSARVTLRLMEAMDSAGHRAGAIRQAGVHAEGLRRELGVGADPEVEALAARLRAASEPLVRPLAGRPEFSPRVTDESRVVSVGAATPELGQGVNLGEYVPEPRLGVPPEPAPMRPGENPLSIVRPPSATRAVLALAAAMSLLAVGAWTLPWPAPASAPAEPERLLLAEIADHTGDAALGDVITQVLRHELARSPRLDLVGRARTEAALERMRVEPDAVLSLDLARDMAAREEIRIVVTSDARLVGRGVVISAAVIDAASGDVIHGASEMASDSTELIAAVRRLSDGIRQGIGERLGSIGAAEPLWSFTTSSLPALRKQRAEIAAWVNGENLRGVELSEEAIALDPDFAHAHVALAGELEWAGLPRGRAVAGLVRAYRSRLALTERESHAIEGHYHLTVTGDVRQALRAFRNLLETRECLDREPCWQSVIAATMELSGDFAAAEHFVTQLGPIAPTPVQVVRVRVLHALGKTTEARQLLSAQSERDPEHPGLLRLQVALLADSGRFDEAHALATRIRRNSGLRNDLYAQAALDAMRGRHREAVTHLRELRDQALALGEHGAAVGIAVTAGRLRLRAGDPTGASEVDDLLNRLDSTDVLSRPYLPLALLHAEAAQSRRARAWLAAYEREVPLALQGPDRPLLHRTRAAVLQAEGNFALALQEMLEAAHLPAGRTGLFDDPAIRAADHPALARIYEAMGAGDSAVAVYERYLAARSLERIATDALELGDALERLGILYERRGERSRAAAQTQRFVTLWRDAGPVPQRRVSAARQRAAALMAPVASAPARDR